MDWLLLLGLVSLLIVGAIASFYLYVFVTRTREEFRAAQPDLRVTNMSAMSSGTVLTIYPELENLGGGGGVRLSFAHGWVGREFCRQESLSPGFTESEARGLHRFGSGRTNPLNRD